MNLYDKDIELFKQKIDSIDLSTTIELELMDYDNEKECELLDMIIRKYRELNNEHFLEELHRLCECEIIFDYIWSFDRNEFYRKTKQFNLHSVAGSSFLHEFVKQIQIGQLDYFNELVAICSIKYFKTPKKAEEYFDMLIERVKGIPGLDLESTIKQKENFKDVFTKYKSLHMLNR